MGTILRYLVEEYSKYESGYSDMFSPYRRDKIRTTFMGAAGSATISQVQQVVEASRTGLEENLKNQVEQLQNRIDSMEDSIKTMLINELRAGEIDHIQNV